MAITIFSAKFDQGNNLNVVICCHYEDGCCCLGDTPEHYSHYEKLPDNITDPRAWIKERMTLWLARSETSMKSRAPIQELVEQLVGLSSDGIDRIL